MILFFYMTTTFYMMGAIILLFFLFFAVNIWGGKKEHLCFGNDFCNGNKDSALCVNQECYECGINAPCKNNSECGPNLCVGGCCDGT